MGIMLILKTIVPALIFYIGSIIVIVFSITRRIDKALLLLIPLFPLQNVIEKLHQFPLGNQFIDILLIAIMLGWFTESHAARKPFFAKTPFNAVLILMGVYTYILLWTGSSYLYFPAPISVSDERLQAWKNYMILPLLYFIVVNNIKNLSQIKKLIIAMALGFLIVDYYTGKQIRLTPGLASREKIDGTFVWLGVNEVAAFFVHYGFVFLGIFMLVKKKSIKYLSGLIFFTGVYVVLFLFSRGAYLGMLAGLFAIALIRKKILLIPIILLFIFWQSILPQSVVDRIKYTKNEETGMLDDSSQKRLNVWENSIQLFKENPITGGGYCIFPYLGYELGDTHNIYMKVLAEQGIIGVILLLILFWLALKSSLKLYKTAQDSLLKGLGLGFLGCIVATMTTNIFGDRWTYLQLGAYYWVFLALVVRANMILRERLHKP